jgi:hypothetical protein
VLTFALNIVALELQWNIDPYYQWCIACTIDETWKHSAPLTVLQLFECVWFCRLKHRACFLICYINDPYHVHWANLDIPFSFDGFNFI